MINPIYDQEKEIQSAIELAKEGKRKKAITILRKLLQQNPRNPRAWYLLSQVAEDTDKSIQCLEKALELEPDNPQIKAKLKKLKRLAPHPELNLDATPNPPNKIDKKKSEFTIKWLPAFSVVIILFAMVAIMVDCSNKRKANEIAQKALCVPASSAQISDLRESIKYKADYNDIESTYMVRSNDYQKVYFVAAQITGPGLDNIIGVWAITGDPDTPGMFFSVNGYAHVFSGFGIGSTTDANFTMDKHGAEEAYFCAEK